MRYSRNGKVYITGGPEGLEGEMIRKVCQQYPSAFNFFEAIGIDMTAWKEAHVSPPATMLRSLIYAERGFEPHQWKKLNELYKKIKPSQSPGTTH